MKDAEEKFKGQSSKFKRKNQFRSPLTAHRIPPVDGAVSGRRSAVGGL
jgi:hypothetical protein